MVKSEDKMNIGIFGGAFNPIHLGHLILAQSAKEEYSLDKVLFVVSANPPHKDSINVSFDHRYNMVSLALKDNLFFEVSDIEREVEGKSYTYYVLQKIKEKYGKENDYFLIIGQDEANYFDKWFKYEEILKMCKVIVGARETDLSPNNISFDYITMPNIDISSSDLREKIKNTKSVRYYTTYEVVIYINKNDLYK